MIPITDIMSQARKGEFVVLASEDFANLVKKVDETGKKGKMTLTIVITPDKHGGREKTLSFDHAVAYPKKSARDALFYSTDEGDLVRNDPDQGSLFRDADDPRAAAPRAV